MGATAELESTLSGGRLGGISTMVTQADVCPSCGGHHESRRRSFWDRSGRVEPTCPLFVPGPFPMMMKLPDPQEVFLEPAGIDIQPVFPENGPGPNPAVTRRLSQLPIPWPTPSFDEGSL